MPKTLGELEQMVLLAIVALGDEAYGAAVRREIAKRTGRDVPAGAIYTVLDRLERGGLVASHVGRPTAERGGRRKRHYRMRVDGAKALETSLERMRRMADGLDERLAGLAREVEA